MKLSETGMATELEQKLMSEIGLGCHYGFYNGSGSCRGIREKAVRLLPEVIRQAHEEGKETALPDQRLIDLAVLATHCENHEELDLTKTWQVCSTVLQIHCQLHFTPEAEREHFIGTMVKDIKRVFGLKDVFQECSVDMNGFPFCREWHF
jgi:hypothetical protein